MANAMDWLGVGSACYPAQDADDDDDDPRRRPRGRDASPETPTLGHSAGGRFEACTSTTTG